MRVKGNRSWVARKRLAVNKGRHRPMLRSDLRRAQRLVPDIEVVAQRVHALARRLDVDDPVRRVGMQPVEALAGYNECAGRGLDDLRGWNDADAFWDDPELAVRIHGEMRVNVVNDLLCRVAADAVNRLPLRLSVRAGQQSRTVVGKLVDHEDCASDDDEGAEARHDA